MERSDILKQINGIFIDIFQDAEIILTYDTSAIDIEEWDSLTHIHLTVAIEKNFNIRLTSEERQKWYNIEGIIDLINKRITV